MCYHFIINVSATFCWLNTDHQKTLSKAVCTYLSTNCYVYVAYVCRVLCRCVYTCVRAGRSDVTGWMTNRTEPYRIKPNQIESNRIGPDQIRYSFLPLSFYYLHNRKITKAFCFAVRRDEGKRATRANHALAVSNRCAGVSSVQLFHLTIYLFTSIPLKLEFFSLSIDHQFTYLFDEASEWRAASERANE